MEEDRVYLEGILLEAKIDPKPILLSFDAIQIMTNNECEPTDVSEHKISHVEADSFDMDGLFDTLIECLTTQP